MIRSGWRCAILACWCAAFGQSDAAARGRSQLHSYRVSDFLSLEGLGRAEFAPSGQRLVWEQAPPYSQIGDYSVPATGAFEGGFGIRIAETHNGNGGSRFLERPRPGVSYWIDRFSDDGRFLTAVQARGERIGMRVYDLQARRFHDLDVAPDLGPAHYAALWLNDHEFVVLGYTDLVPPDIAARPFSARGYAESWARARGGNAVTADMVTTSALRPQTHRARNLILRVDAASGASSILGRGTFRDIALSADRRYVRAVVDTGENGGSAASSGDMVFDLRDNRATTSAPPSPASPDWRFTTRRNWRHEPCQDFGVARCPPHGSWMATSADQGMRLLRLNGSDGTDIVLQDRAGRNLTLARLNRLLAGVIAPRRSSLSYAVHTQGGDRTFNACLILPPDYRPGRRYPVIVDLYPQRTEDCAPASDPMQALGARRAPFDLSLLAARGYVVFRPGTVQQIAIRNGVAVDEMAPVVDQGLDALEAAGIADPRRIGLFGFSQGGFAALWVAAQSRRYAAVVAMNGMTDLYSARFEGSFLNRHFAEITPYRGSGRTDHPGGQLFISADPWAEPAAYVEQSALTHVRDITAPVLLIHSDMDEAFPMSQFEAFFAALNRAGKRAAFIRYWGEGHGPSSPANIRHLIANLFAWYDEHLDVARDANGNLRWADPTALSRGGSPPRTADWFAQLDR